MKLRRRLSGRLGDRLVADELITEGQLLQAQDVEARTEGFLGEILVQMGFIAPGRLGPYVEEVTGFPFVDISDTEVDPLAVMLIPESLALAKKVLALREEGDRVVVAMVDPLDIATVDELKAKLGRPISPHLALSADLDDAIKRAFDVRAKARTLIDEISSQIVVQEEEDQFDQVEEAPIVKLINQILSGAIGSGASDVHIEPHESHIRVRYRVDGLLYEQMQIPTAYLSACISRLKVMSSLDIAERRRPQDGRFTTRDEHDHEFDVRLSIMPTVYGEKACMRLLEKQNTIANLDKVGFLPAQRELFDRFIHRPHGLILVTGPTGSGKSTSLYAALQSINDPDVNINTVEDPVEYKLPGVNQMQVNAKIGVTFSSGLRTLVRQDPDVILVGEIRDKDTAEISIQAALTGHLVLSTLHTNDAPGALIRLQNMGVESFLIASAVVGIQGQRLLRTICSSCKETYVPTLELCQAAGIPLQDGRVPTLARGVGCKRCGGRGTRGRTAAMELMAMTDSMRQMVLENVSGADLYRQALIEGMTTMRDAAIQKALDHSVPPEEIVRVFSRDD